jgi:hypothetical protein
MAEALRSAYSNMGADMLNEVKNYITQDDGAQWDRLPKGVRIFLILAILLSIGIINKYSIFVSYRLLLFMLLIQI